MDLILGEMTPSSAQIKSYQKDSKICARKLASTLNKHTKLGEQNFFPSNITILLNNIK